MSPVSFILENIKKSGDLLLRIQREGFETMAKNGDPRDIVTSADKRISEMLVHEIQREFPTHGIYSEEDSNSMYTHEHLWVIDPIDGSSNFSRGIPHFSICLGLLEHGIPVAGAVFNPVTNELFHFEKDVGAFVNQKPMHVSQTTDLHKAHVLLHAGRKKELQSWGGTSYKRLLENAHKSGNFGSSALDICFVAAGRVEANVYGTLSTLDCSPAIGILTEAGGIASDKHGNKLTFTREPQMTFTANNQKMLDTVRELLMS